MDFNELENVYGNEIDISYANEGLGIPLKQNNKTIKQLKLREPKFIYKRNNPKLNKKFNLNIINKKASEKRKHLKQKHKEIMQQLKKKHEEEIKNLEKKFDIEEKELEKSINQEVENAINDMLNE